VKGKSCNTKTRPKGKGFAVRKKPGFRWKSGREKLSSARKGTHGWCSVVQRRGPTMSWVLKVGEKHAPEGLGET